MLYVWVCSLLLVWGGGEQGGRVTDTDRNQTKSITGIEIKLKSPICAK